MPRPFSFNRNIVECKEKMGYEITNRIVVLIETLWNVKVSMGQRFLNGFQVLIETLWNVKHFDFHIGTDCSTF